MTPETLSLAVFEEFTGSHVQRFAQQSERRGFERRGDSGLCEGVGGRHREARQLREAVGCDPLHIEDFGEVPSEWHGRKVLPNVRLDNSKVAPYRTAMDSRRCELCGKREIDPPKREGITRFLGLWAHLTCFNKAKRDGRIEIVRGRGFVLRSTTEGSDV